MRILVVTPSADNAHLVKWVQAAQTHGHEIHLLCHRPGGNPLGLPCLTVPIHTDRAAKHLERWLHVRACRALIRRFHPDLVHVHAMDSTMTVLGWVQAKPLLVSIWGSDVADPVAPWNEAFRRWGLRSATCIVATNPLLEYMVRSHVGLEARVEVIPFGVDTDRFAPAAEPSAGPFRVGFVKHLEPIYGCDVLVEAMERVCREVPEARLDIVGRGSRLEEVQALVRRLGLQDHVRFLGRVPNEEVPALLATFHVLAMPSLSESFGVSALEAAACGLPVVASRVGGIPDVVQDGVTGLLVPARDPQAMADSLLWMARNPSEARRMGLAGRALVQRSYEWRTCTDRMESLYQELAGGTQGRTGRPSSSSE